MRNLQKGFTAVEVLVTLFIATTLLAGGYQAYSAVVNSSGDGRERGIASNLGYVNLRQESSNPPATCSSQATTTLSGRIPSNTRLTKPYSMTRTVTCPYGTDSPISLYRITVTYGPDNKKITHGLYAS